VHQRAGTNNLTHIESHTALRGIAAVTVVMAHLHAWDLFPQWPWLRDAYQIFDWSDLAVFLFFILSGFVMSYIYPSPVRWRHFFVARLARLTPVYEVTLLVTFALTFISAHMPMPTASNFFANLLMIQQWLPVPDWFPINAPSWSLSIEAFLYLITFPLLVWFRKQPWSWLLYIPLILGGALWAAIYYNIYDHFLWYRKELAILSGLFGFGIGFAMQNLIPNGLRYSGAITAIGITIMACGLFHWILPHGIIAIGLILIVASMINADALPYKLLARPVFLYLGNISYSLYLWNMPILIFLQECRAYVEYHYLTSALAILGFRIIFTGVALVSILTISHLSYYKLEAPFRRLIRDHLTRARSRTVNSIALEPNA
jgi:peptidoglycan/LPS O-acetylase OafA/YrhL